MTIYPPLSIYIAAHGKILYAGRRLSILTVQKGHMQWKRNVYLLSSILIRGPWVSQKYSTRLPAPPLHILCRPLFRLTHLGDVACFPREHTAFPYALCRAACLWPCSGRVWLCHHLLAPCQASGCPQSSATTNSSEQWSSYVHTWISAQISA